MLRSNAFYLAILCAGLCAAIGAFGVSRFSRAENRGAIPAPKDDVPLAQHSGRETAVFAGGCFWGTQAVFERVKGVVATTAGYAGGSAETATYDQVTTETTGHAESVKVVYDPSRITYGKLLQVFFSVHDPTTLNRQGPDVGNVVPFGDFLFERGAEEDRHRIHCATGRGPGFSKADCD